MSHLLTKFFISRKPLIKQALRYAAVGVWGATFDITLFTILNQWFFGGVHYLLANIISLISSNIFTYFIQKKWTFKHKYARHRIQMPIYFFTSFIGLGCNEILLFFAVHYLHWQATGAKILIAFMVFFVNFTLDKHLTFNGRLK